MFYVSMLYIFIYITYDMKKDGSDDFYGCCYEIFNNIQSSSYSLLVEKLKEIQSFFHFLFFKKKEENMDPVKDVRATIVRGLSDF